MSELGVMDMSFFESGVLFLLICLVVMLRNIFNQIAQVNRHLYYQRWGEDDPSYKDD
jgi:hypothetical protein